jgi:hypothetical protein
MIFQSGGAAEVAAVDGPTQEQDIKITELRHCMNAGTGTQPMPIPIAVAEAIAEELHQKPVTLTGPEFRKLRLAHPKLASAEPAGDVSADQVIEPDQHCSHCGANQGSRLSLFAQTWWPRTLHGIPAQSPGGLISRLSEEYLVEMPL